MLLWNFTWISILKIKSLGSKTKYINLIYSSNHFSSSQTKFDLMIINLKRNQLKAKSCWTRSTQLTLTRLRVPLRSQRLRSQLWVRCGTERGGWVTAVARCGEEGVDKNVDLVDFAGHSSGYGPCPDRIWSDSTFERTGPL